MAEPSALRLNYSDNQRITVGDRLAAEIAEDSTRLWVASGYFAPSVWGVVGSALSQLGTFRLLLGKDLQLANLDRGHEEARIAELVRQAVRAETEPPGLASRAEAEGVAALIAFLERHRGSGDPVVKLWDGDGFLHAKAYLLRNSVGIGSANFTASGLNHNRELVGWRQDRGVVAEVEEWFRGYWEDERSRDYTSELIDLLEATPLVSDDYPPYAVLIRALASRYGIERPPSLERASFTLQWFQEDAVFRLIRLLNSRSRGALLADAVGLGKTFMAMAVIHHFLYTHEGPRRGRGKPVLLVVPKSLVPMWERELQDKGFDWACEILTVQMLRAELDVSRYQGADLVVIDEAQRLRGGRVWFRKIIDLVTGGEAADDRRVLLLTATPVNTGMDDLVTLLRVLTKNNRRVWVPEIADFERYLKRVERGEADPFPILDRSIVRRSRTDILRAQDEALAAGLNVDRVQLPERQPVHVNHDYGGNDDLFDEFARALRELILAPYDLERFRRADAPVIDALPLIDADGVEIDLGETDLNFRPGSLAALVATGLLVRFQSSIVAVRRSLRRVDAVMARSVQALMLDPPRLLDLRASPQVKRLLAEEAQEDHDEAEEPDEDGGIGTRWDAVLAEAPELLEPREYDLAAIRIAIDHDREIVARLLAQLPVPADDGKVASLVACLRRPLAQSATGTPGLAKRRVLIFSQFRDTARFVHERLVEEGFAVALVDGAVTGERRAEITAWFDPSRSDARETHARVEGIERPEILVSTDVLAEGHNLQLADTVVNYDLHFNPQVAVQRAGRVDRLGSPHQTVYLVSFLPPEGLDKHIGLLARLDERFRRIHGLGLGDEQVTPLAADRQAHTLEQIRRLYADDASVLDEVERTWTLGSTDYMRQPLEAFLQQAGRERVKDIPVGVSSVKRLPIDAPLGQGAFLAIAGPADRSEQRETYWRFYPRLPDGTWGEALSDEVAIFRAIACRQQEPRAVAPWESAGPTVIDWDLLRRAASELAHQLTVERSTAEVAAGASERSRQLRQELRGNLSGLEVERADDLLERLLQVRIEDYDGRTGWRQFADSRRRLNRAESLGERREAAEEIVGVGLHLFGAPVEADEEPVAPIEVDPADLQLVAYEALVDPSAAAVASVAPYSPGGRLFDQEGDQLSIEPGGS